MTLVLRVTLCVALSTLPLLSSCGSSEADGEDNSLAQMAPEGVRVGIGYHGPATCTAEPWLIVREGPSFSAAAKGSGLKFAENVTVSDVKWDKASDSYYANIGRGWVDVRWLKKSGVGEHEDTQCSVQHDAAYSAAPVTGETKAFLSIIGFAEGTGNCYNYMYGYKRFSDYSRHPEECRPFANTCSTAAGRYQMLARTWHDIQRVKGFSSFAPIFQDGGATYLLERRDVPNHNQKMSYTQFVEAMKKLSWEWASLPPGRYGQGFKSYDTMWLKYSKYLQE